MSEVIGNFILFMCGFVFAKISSEKTNISRRIKNITTIKKLFSNSMLNVADFKYIAKGDKDLEKWFLKNCNEGVFAVGGTNENA